MLQSLSVKNYALLSDVEIRFGAGLNMLTGETGAGKSILIGALGTILGERIDGSVLQNGRSKTVIEGHFEINGHAALQKLLEENELIADDNVLILRRELSENMRSRAFINDTPVPLALLEQVGDLLVDLHGQHQHQSLLKVSNHLNFLDLFGDLHKERDTVTETFDEMQDLLTEIKRLEEEHKSFREKQEMCEFQLNEINKVNPTEDEEDELVREEKIIQNSERLYRLTNEFYGSLYDNENSVFDQMNRVELGLEELTEIDDQFTGYRADLSNAKVVVEELANFFRKYLDQLDFSAERLEQIQLRLASLAGLKKRFGRSIREVIKFREELRARMVTSESLLDEIQTLKVRFAAIKDRFSELCLDLSQKRQKYAAELEKLLPEILLCLGLSNVRFKVALRYQDDATGVVESHGKNYRATSTGMDFAEFLISLNQGEDLRPLAKVASGGEISRIMLAIKSILARRGQVPILVFDEIDNGVSGRIAQAVGRKLKDISKMHQVICITHLPQIASMGAQHYLVEKADVAGRTETRIRELGANERTEAIARLLAGETVSETHLSSARELIQDAVN